MAPYDLRDAVRIAWDGRLMVVACFVLSLVTAVMFTTTITPEYLSKARVLVSDNDPGDPNATGGTEDPDVRAATVQDLATQPAIGAAVVKKLDLPYGSDVVAEKVTADLKPNSRVLTIQAMDDTPEGAKALANTYADEFVRFRLELTRGRASEALVRLRRELAAVRRRPDSAQRRVAVRDVQDQVGTLEVRLAASVGDSEVIQRGGAPSVPVAPNKKKNYALGAIFGLIFGFGLAGLRDRLDPRVKDARQLKALLPDVPVLATPQGGGGAKAQVATAEGFRTLHANLTFLDPDRPLRTLLVTSTSEGDGKSTTSVNLALAMGERGQRVLVLDGNLRHATLSEGLELGSVPGVSTYLGGGATRLDELLRRVEVNTAQPNGAGPAVAFSGELFVVPSGPVPPNPGALLNSSTLDSLLAQAEEAADCVIVNGAPFGAYGDVLPVGRRADGVIVVVRLRHSRRDDLERLPAMLSQASMRLLGLVVFGVRERR